MFSYIFCAICFVMDAVTKNFELYGIMGSLFFIAGNILVSGNIIANAIKEKKYNNKDISKEN